MDVLFVHGGGAGAYDEDSKLAASLQKALGSSYTVHYPKMPGEEAPNYEAWRERMLEECSDFGADFVLVGHSLGGSLLLKMLVEGQLKPAGVFLVASPYWGTPDWEEASYALPEGFAARLLPGLPLVFYHSRDDEWVPFAHQAIYAEKLPQATIRAFEDRGHQFGSDLSEVAVDIQKLIGAA